MAEYCKMRVASILSSKQLYHKQRCVNKNVTDNPVYMSVHLVLFLIRTSFSLVALYATRILQNYAEFPSQKFSYEGCIISNDE
jgi:ribosome biogenesis protein Nip4